jgi:hypothetical protein
MSSGSKVTAVTLGIRLSGVAEKRSKATARTSSEKNPSLRGMEKEGVTMCSIEFKP